MKKYLDLMTKNALNVKAKAWYSYSLLYVKFFILQGIMNKCTSVSHTLSQDFKFKCRYLLLLLIIIKNFNKKFKISIFFEFQIPFILKINNINISIV